MIRFRCPSCGSKLRVPSSYVGRAIQCPKCEQAVRVPQPQARPDAPADTTSPFNRRPETPAARSDAQPAAPPLPTEPAEALAQAAMEDDYYEPAPSHARQPARRTGYYNEPPLRHRRKHSGDVPGPIIALGIFLMILTGLMGYFIGRSHMDAIWQDRISKKPPTTTVAKPAPLPPSKNPTVAVGQTRMRDPFPTIVPSELQNRDDFLIERFEAFVIDSNDKEKTLLTSLKLKNTSNAKHFYNVTYEFVTNGGKIVQQEHDAWEFDPGGNQRRESKYYFPLSTFKDFNAVRLNVKVE